ncbi:MAG TPA: metal-dependent hydrolase [Candidatus Binataceae bacterium]|nr:metal-dependent hydrolase [Candidatus Binataceae bacterium]
MSPSSAHPAIPIRQISFDESLRDLPKHFAGEGDLITSHWLAALSGVFPEGERFFVRSVQHFRDRIDDPELKREMVGFSGQEVVHARVHNALNNRLAELGYPTRRYERNTRFGLKLQTRFFSPMRNLAVTAALEHFTATMAELVLTNEDARRMFGEGAVQNLFLWHALEEAEHKAVSFDVYKAVGGSERMRVKVMNSIRWGFTLGTAVQVLISLLGDRDTYRRGNLRRSWRKFRASPFMSKRFWQRLKDYNRPDFHPGDCDTTALVTQWRAELFGQHGTLNDKLMSSAA